MSGAATINVSANRSANTFHLQQAFKLALSLVLFYWLALGMNWDVPQYGSLAIVIVSLGTTGATVEKGLMRFVGTTAGVAVGFLILGLFNHDRWAAMLAFAVYIMVIGYFMQASRYSYAWYVAAFVPLVVWGDNYPHFNDAFYFGTFRWLETTVGMLIYTAVDLLFWPHNAGENLHQKGRKLCFDVRELFGNLRQQLEQGRLSEGGSNRRTQLAGTLAGTVSTLQDAYADTPGVNAQKRVWEVWCMNARALVDALELWQEVIGDCRELDLAQMIPKLGPMLDTLDQRLKRIGNLWEARCTADNSPDAHDRALMERLALDWDHSVFAELSHTERATLMSYLGQLEVLDQASRDLLRTMWVLAGLEDRQDFRTSLPGRNWFVPSWWDPTRLRHALFPPAAFIVAFFFWVFMNPPTGASVPMFAGILSLVILRTPMNPLSLLVVLVLSIFLAVAPVYWLVMPRLSTGFDLLSLIFLYSFVFGYLGGRSPALKSGPIILFVMMTGISNRQSYSFQGPVDGALMILLAGTILTVVYYSVVPTQPEPALLRSVRQFFRGCAGVIGGLALVDPSDHAKEPRLRKRYLEAMVLATPDKIQTAQRKLNRKLHPDKDLETVQRLHDCAQSTAFRLQSLEIAYDRIARHTSETPDSLGPLCRQVSEHLHRVFANWASFDPGDEFEQIRGSLQVLIRKMEQQLDVAEEERNRGRISDGMLAALYALVGNLRGLINAMARAQGAINQINWRQWETTRF